MFKRALHLSALAALALAPTVASAASAAPASATSGGGLVWGTPQTVDAGRQILSIACQRSSGCLFGDDDGSVFAQAPGSTGWTRIFHDGGEQITTLKCVGAHHCVALDGYPGDSGGYFGKIVAIDPVTGHTSAERIPLHAPGPDNFGGIDGLACAGTTCTITSEYRAGGGAPTLRSTRPWLAASWRRIPRAQAFPGDTCPAATTCLGRSGRAIVIDTRTGNRTRRQRVGIHAPGYLSAVSCGSLAFCVAVDESGDALESRAPADGESWTRAQITGSALTSVSCLPRRCLAGTADGALIAATVPGSS